MVSLRKKEKVQARVLSEDSEEKCSEEKPENRLVTITHTTNGINLFSGRRRRVFRSMSSDLKVFSASSSSRRRSMSRDQKVLSASSSSRRRSKRIRNANSVLRQPLRDTLFHHCFQNIWRESPEERRSQFTFMNCEWFYLYTNEQYRERVLSWIKKKNIFSKTYVFVPIVLRFHWSLLIFCNLGESLFSETTTPCILLLDSLHTFNAPRRLKPLIRRFVSDIFEIEDRSEDSDMIQNIPLFVPKVPQQRNEKECGIFVLYYMCRFLESAPQRFSISNGYPYFLKKDWFTEEEVEGFYERLEAHGLESSDSEECSEPSDSEGIIIERICAEDFLKSRRKRQS